MPVAAPAPAQQEPETLVGRPTASDAVVTGWFIAPTADDSDSWQDSMRHIAREARCYVPTSCVLQHASSHPPEVPIADGPELMDRGGAAILAPDGTYLAGPLYDEPGIVYATLDPDRLSRHLRELPRALFT